MANWVVLGLVILGVIALLLIVGVVGYTKLSYKPRAEEEEMGAFRYMGV